MHPLIVYNSIMMVSANQVRNKAFAEAKRLAGDKGIVNIGSGCNRSFAAKQVCYDDEVLANVDKAGGGPNFHQVDLEIGQLPFEDKQFDCAFASHVLEHLYNWEAALDEWCRIADHVVVVFPHPATLNCYLWPGHKQYFSLKDREQIERRWPSVKVFM